MNDPIVKMAFPVRELLHQVTDCGITTLKTGPRALEGHQGWCPFSLPFIFAEPHITCPPSSTLPPRNGQFPPGQILPTS